MAEQGAGASQPKMDISELSQKIFRSLMSGIKQSNQLTAGKDDYDLYNSFKGFRKVMKVEASMVQNLMSNILVQQDIKGSFHSKDVDEMLDGLVDANDAILEKVGNAIDEATGAKKEVDPILVTAVTPKVNINTSWNKRKLDEDVSPSYRLLAARNIARPQLKFKDKVDNSYEPFVPIIKEKPNSIKPLSVILEQTEYGERYSHPYQCELDHFKPGKMHLRKANLKTPKSEVETPLKFIDTADHLNLLLSDLKSQTEFAVDLEHHSYRSFQGITCLMQISTRDTDYIIDTLELRGELSIMNEVFTDPKILKVFHGADKDIEWLQRDFGIYVVNMFDTGQASRVLNFAHFSLAYLLKHYFQVEADKQFQLADWRIRPLPEDMAAYARSDTHYLLHICDRIKNELLAKGNAESNLLLSVFQRSKIVCEKRYEKPSYQSDGYMTVCKKSRKIFNTRQIYALRELYHWRNLTARREDESTGYVLPNHMLLQIAEVLPREMQGILACCNPIPPLVKQNLNELHWIILQAREQSLIKPISQDLQIQVSERRHDVDLENVLQCPHDISHMKDMDSIDTGPTLLDMWNKHGEKLENELYPDKDSGITLKTTPDLTSLVSVAGIKSVKNDKLNIKKLMTEFQTYLSPFMRYKLVNPMLSKTVDDVPAKSKSASSDQTDDQNRVESIKEHFLTLLKTHGDSGSNQGSAASDTKPLESAEQTAPSTSKKDDHTSEKPIRKQINSEKKKEKSKKRNNADFAAEEGRQTKKLVVDEASFKPFDYTKADTKIFTGGKKGGKKHFDPNAGTATTNFKPGKRRNKAKGKSLTYSYKNDKGSKNVQWPKR